MSEGPLARLEERLGHRFSDPELLRRALAHRSYVAEHSDTVSNERLEFLGDAVLGSIVTDRIFHDYPELPEGEMAKVRAAVVSSVALAQMAQEVGIGEHVLLGRGEEQSGGRQKASILADAMEAVIGAVYLDGGWSAARPVVLGLMGDRIDEAAARPGTHDYKTRLQEVAIRLLDESPRYEVTSTGPDHAREFEAVAYLRGEERGRGSGTSKKQAEQEAAAGAWDWLATQVEEAEMTGRPEHDGASDA